MAQTPEEKKAYRHQYYLKNKDKSNKESKKYYDEHPEKRKKWRDTYDSTHKPERRKQHLKKTFNLTVESYNEMFELQQGKCAICGIHQSELPKPLYVDHCHSSGKVRGLLCQKCNTGIGMLQDDLFLVTKAMEYLQDAA